jgi:hypothetical protein
VREFDWMDIVTPRMLKDRETYEITINTESLGFALRSEPLNHTLVVSRVAEPLLEGIVQVSVSVLLQSVCQLKT